MAVELHGGFVWDCDECGRENYERAIEGNIDEAALMADENQVVGCLVAPESRELDNGLMESEVLIQTILVAPRTVRCKHCGGSFATEVAASDE